MAFCQTKVVFDEVVIKYLTFSESCNLNVLVFALSIFHLAFPLVCQAATAPLGLCVLCMVKESPSRIFGTKVAPDSSKTFSRILSISFGIQMHHHFSYEGQLILKRR